MITFKFLSELKSENYFKMKVRIFDHLSGMIYLCVYYAPIDILKGRGYIKEGGRITIKGMVHAKCFRVTSLC